MRQYMNRWYSQESQQNILKQLTDAIRLLRPNCKISSAGITKKCPTLMAKVSEMEDINKCVAEFVIRRQHNPRVSPTNLLTALQFGDTPDCPNLKISSVLRDISNSLIQDTVDEGTLDLLEILEKLQYSVLMESHKPAYCWMAVECTVRFMWPLAASDGLFTDAVERIWTRRIGILKESGSDLVTYELLKWESDLKKAVEDPELYQRIRETNVRYTAISFLNQVLKEQWALHGCSSLESVAQRSLKLKAESTRHLESVTIGNANERCGTGEDVEGVGCLENEQHAAEERTTGAQEQEHVTPPPGRVNRTGTSGQNHNEGAVNDNVNVDSQETWSGRPRPVRRPMRRPTKFWTPEEVEVLREGVKEFGKSWKYIKNANPVVFAERTEVDLKDKWRNLTR